MLTTKNPALLIIDVQHAIDHFALDERSQPDAERNIQTLLALWRHHGLPVVHIRHSSRSLNSPYHAESGFYGFKPEVEPMEGETVITKRENCAFINTALEQWLTDENIQELVITGVLLNHSVDTSVRVAHGLGFRVILPSDTTAASSLTLANGTKVGAKHIHEITLANLRNEYAEITDCQTLRQSLQQRQASAP